VEFHIPRGDIPWTYIPPHINDVNQTIDASDHYSMDQLLPEVMVEKRGVPKIVSGIMVV